MKVLLSIFCGLVVLFAGGCAILALVSGGSSASISMGPLVLIPGGAAVLNVMVLAALWGFARPNKGVLITLLVLDALVVLTLAIGWGSIGLADRDLNTLAALVIGAFAVKGVLTYLYLRSL